MKFFKVKFLVSIHLLFFSLVIIQGCCRDDFRLTSTGSITLYEISMNEQDQEVWDDIENISNEFLMVAYFDLEVVSVPSFSLLSECYAFSCDKTPINQVLPGTISVTLDRAFTWNGEVMSAETNLLDLPSNGILTRNNDEQYVNIDGHMELDFSSLFIDQFDIEDGDAVFTIKASTDDQLDLLATHPTYFNL